MPAARQPSEWSNSPGFGLEQEKIAAAANAVLGTSAQGDALVKSVAASLTAEWSRPGPRPLTKALVKARAIRIDNLPDEDSADAVVVLTSWEGKVDPVTLDVAGALRGRYLQAVGAQALNASSDVADTFAAEGFGAVNDLGTPRGEYSLSVLLAGLADGCYGTGPTADAPFPPLPALAGD